MSNYTGNDYALNKNSETQKLSTLRGEISSAENIRKRVELMEVEQNVKIKNRQTEI